MGTHYYICQKTKEGQQEDFVSHARGEPFSTEQVRTNLFARYVG